MRRPDTYVSGRAVAASPAVYQVLHGNLTGKPSTIRHVMLPGVLAAVCLGASASLYPALARGGFPVAQPSIPNVLTPWLGRDAAQPIGVNCPMDQPNGELETLLEYCAG